MVLTTVPEADAASQVDQLFGAVATRYAERVLDHPMIRALTAGTLPREAIQAYLRNWYTFALDVNALMGAQYRQRLDILKLDSEVEALTVDKIADEYTHPGRGGHIRTVERLGTALGVSRDEMVHAHLIPEARAWTDWVIYRVLAATPAEDAAGTAVEECFSQFAQAWRDALTIHYGISRADVEYFSLHHEADSQEHAEGVMGHGDSARYRLRRLLERGEAVAMPGWGLSHCAFTTVEMIRGLLDGVYNRFGGPSAHPIDEYDFTPRSMSWTAEELLEAVEQRFTERILEHPCTKALVAGQLDRDRLRLFLTNWHRCQLEWTADTATMYGRDVAFIKLHPDVEERVLDSIGWELLQPQPGGPARALRHLAPALGLSMDELLTAELSPKATAFVAWAWRMFREATTAELYATCLWQAPFGQRWLPMLGEALRTRYGMSETETRYFGLYDRRDSEAHHLYPLRKALEAGPLVERPGWGLAYSALIPVDLLAMLLDGVLAAEPAPARFWSPSPRA
ncbi:MAG: hypothetical protein GEU73_07100 [Chloroflexi bacterium]|nr:hypothetical protein [Chloroflexota bacterium]